MKKYSYGKIIGSSWKQTAQILFRPFQLKKWVLLGLIAMLAGQFVSYRFNINVGERASTRYPSSLQAVYGELDEVKNLSPEMVGFLLQDKKFVALLVGLVLLVVITIFLWLRIMAGFSFVFIEAAAKNDASFQIPFHRNSALGRSLFSWSLAYAATVAVAIAPAVYMLAKAGASGGSPDLLGSLFWWCRPYLIALFIAFLPLVLIAVLATDCVQVIMYSQRIGVKKAWGALLALLKRDIGEFVKYLLLKLGFGVVSIFVALALAVLALAAMYGAGAAFSRIGVYVNMLVPPEGRVIVAMALVIITSFAMAGLSVLLAFIFVPIPVFFRLFSIYFTGSLGDECDPFIERTTEPLSKEEFEKLKAETDVSKHNRPIYMLWCTILSSIGIVALFVAMLFEGGRALGRAEAYSLGATMSGPVQLGRQVTPPRTPNENLVKVRLKTGRSFVATIEMETDSSVSFRVKEGTFTFRRDTIESIERQKQ